MMKTNLKGAENVKKQSLKKLKWEKLIFKGHQMTKKSFKGAQMTKKNV